MHNDNSPIAISGKTKASKHTVWKALTDLSELRK